MTPNSLAIIFDLDGTLLDTLKDITLSVNRGIGRFGFPPRSIADYKRFVGDGIEILVRRVLPTGFNDETLFTRILAAVVSEYRQGAIQFTRPYPGIPALLDSLTVRKIPMAVLTNKPHDLAVESVTRLLARWSFVEVWGARDGKPNKPDPTQALALAKRLGTPPANVFFIGDSEIDIHTAKNAGMHAVAVAWGFRPHPDLAAHSPEIIVASPEKLMEHLLEMR